MKIKPYSKSILGISPYVPGSYAKSGKRMVKLSSNENPFGCSQLVKKTVSAGVDNLHRYPDGGAILLREKIAEKNNISDPNRVVCSAGSDEIITLLCMSFAGEGAEVVYTKHGFLMYPISAKACGAEVVIADETNLKTDVDNIISSITEKTKLIFIANPNNPTGSYITESEIVRLIESIPSDVILVMDLAYEEYAVDVSDYPDCFKLVDKYPNVVLTKTFSKAYGIPALRVGWSYSSLEIADILNRVRGPFNLTSLSQAAAVAALEDDEFIAKSVEHNNKWLRIISDEVEKMGLKAYPSIANFVLVDFSTNENAVKVDEYLRAGGISARRMEAYKLDSCIRFSIGLQDENEILLENLKNFMSDQ